MVYEHRTYYLLPGKMQEFLEAFSQTPAKLFEKHGAKLVGFWTTVIGQSNEVIYLLAFRDLAHRERFWEELGQDSEMQQYRQGGVRVEKIVSKILRPSAFSPLQ